MTQIRRTIVLDVAISDEHTLDAAVLFYRAALGTIAAGSDSVGRLVSLGNVLLRVMRPDGREDPYYEQGRAPRLELRVDCVDEALERSRRAGAVLSMRVDDGSYAQVVDPYGHLWSFCGADR